jgi:quercetin 2,3-dioxygenase
MNRQSKAKIFLAEERGLNENSSFRSRHTFNFGNYFNEHKGPFHDIYVVNDDTLDGGRSLRVLVQEHSYIILLPVVGAVVYKDSLRHEGLVAAGQLQIFAVDKGGAIELTNPFKEDQVNFLQIWIKAGSVPAPEPYFLHTYNVNEQPGKLISLSPGNTGKPVLPFTVSIGKFRARAETAYRSMLDTTALFFFVLEGAFEVAGRLMHARDGLALWETTEADMEALSNDAILLLIEIACHKNI